MASLFAAPATASHDGQGKPHKISRCHITLHLLPPHLPPHDRLVTLAAFCFPAVYPTAHPVAAVRIMLGSVYFWSGLWKLMSPAFYEQTAPWFFQVHSVRVRSIAPPMRERTAAVTRGPAMESCRTHSTTARVR